MPSGWVGSGWKTRTRYVPAAWLLISKTYARHRLHCDPGGHYVKAHCKVCVSEVKVDPHAERHGLNAFDVALSALPATKFS